jgi:tetratricopeptide (TPR) repeat protein
VGSILDTQIDDLSRKIAKTVGLSDLKIAASSRPIMEVTTTSMEAYHYYLKGREEIDKHYYHDAVRFLEKAVALDSTFAVAHLTLGTAYLVVRKGDASRRAYEKAMLYSRTTTEKERLYIEATYARAIERQPEKSFRVLRELVEKYPAEKRARLDLGNDYLLKGMYNEAIAELEQVLSLDPTYAAAFNVLAYVHSSMGEYQKALDCFQRYASASPGDANPLDSMAELYFRWGKLNEAVVKYKEALEVKPDFGAERWIAYIYAFDENYPEALKWVDQFISRAPSGGTRGEGYFWRGWIQTLRGNTTEALEDLAHASAVFDSLGTSWGVIGASFTRAVAHQMRGESTLGRADLDKGLEVTRGQYEDAVPPRILVYYGILCCLNELTEEPQPVRERLKKTRVLLPRIAELQGVQSAEWAESACDLLEGEELLRAGSVDDAIRVAKASPSVGTPPMGTAYLWYYNCPVERDVVARAHHQKGDLDKAIGEYEKLVTFDPNQNDRLLVLPIYHYRLAKIYEQKGRTGEATREYQKFLTIMSEADVYLSEIVDAKARVAVLRKRGS